MLLLRAHIRGSKAMQFESDRMRSTADGTVIERLQLPRVERLIDFAPAMFFAYLALLCSALILTSIFLVNVRNPEAIAGAGIFGLLVTVGLGTLLIRTQLNDLRYIRLPTRADAKTNYGIVLKSIQDAGWSVTRSKEAELIDARVADSLLSAGEWVAVRFTGADVWIASICDPRVGFSLVARKRCARYKELVKSAVSAAA
jgi:hypothetical protein